VELDDGDPAELGSLYAGLLRSHPHLRVLGGCCGTDARHVEAIARACVTAT
jgi:methionine synthase I (cobalamin-dependent)